MLYHLPEMRSPHFPPYKLTPIHPSKPRVNEPTTVTPRPVLLETWFLYLPKHLSSLITFYRLVFSSIGRKGELWHTRQRGMYVSGAGQPYIRFSILQVGCLSLMHRVFMAHSLRMLPLRSNCCRFGWVLSTKQRFSHKSLTRTLICSLHWRRKQTSASTGWILTQASATTVSELREQSIWAR